MQTARLTIPALLAVAALAAAAAFNAGAAEGNPPHGDSAAGDATYRVAATDGRLIRRPTGPVHETVQGVPARPVDAFNWGGEGIEPVQGRMTIEVDPVANTGRIRAQWNDRNGHWKLEQTAFAPPPHPTGLEIGRSATATNLIEQDPVVTNVYLHGDATAAEPVLPTLFNLLATWGPARVSLDGHAFDNPYDGPTPAWVAHTMVTEGVRLPDGRVTANGGDDVYSPAEFAGSGDTQRDDREVHLTFHDAPGPVAAGNFPPMHYHVQFEEVDVRIRR